MSLCDRCYDPGRCCRDLSLSRVGGHEITVWADADPVDALRELIGETPLRAMPFAPLSVRAEWTDEDGRPYRAYRWHCTALGPDGRCTVYDRRPELCRSFEPASDALCVHWQGAESDERSVL